MCNRLRKFFACGCPVLNDDGTQKYVRERCESNCGLIKDTNIKFGPVACVAHEVPFNQYGQVEAAGPAAHEMLTVGIEFEFFVAHETTILQQDDVSPERWMLLRVNQGNNPSEVVKRRILALLEDTVPIYSTHVLGRRLQWLKNKIAKFGITPLTDFPEYAMWQITTDSSLRPVRGEDPPGYDFTHTKMELISRVLSENHLDEIETVYRRMPYMHRGDEETEPRGRDDDNEEMNALLPSVGLSDVTLTTFRHIWNSTTLDHIRNELDCCQNPHQEPGKPCALLRGETSGPDMDGNIRPADMTLEFRHREATGDPIVDRRWVELCVALVRCAQLSRIEFIELIRTACNTNVQLGSQPSPETFAALLGALGLETSVDFWQGVYQKFQDRLAKPLAPAILPPLS